MDIKYNLIFKNYYNILYIDYDTNLNNSNKEFKLFIVKYKINYNIHKNEILKQINKYNNYIIYNNIIIIITQFNDYTIKYHWFYNNRSNYYNEIINSSKIDKLKFFNININKFIFPNLKYKDIFILLYNNGKL
jgi:hypothetical protein